MCVLYRSSTATSDLKGLLKVWKQEPTCNLIYHDLPTDMLVLYKLSELMACVCMFHSNLIIIEFKIENNEQLVQFLVRKLLSW